MICLGGPQCAGLRTIHPRGFSNVNSVAGGTRACVEAGLPVTRGKKTISLERQYGSPPIVGAERRFIGVQVHPGFLGIAGFVGAGLLFAESPTPAEWVMLLARMP